MSLTLIKEIQVGFEYINSFTDSARQALCIGEKISPDLEGTQSIEDKKLNRFLKEYESFYRFLLLRAY